MPPVNLQDAPSESPERMGSFRLSHFGSMQSQSMPSRHRSFSGSTPQQNRARFASLSRSSQGGGSLPDMSMSPLSDSEEDEKRETNTWEHRDKKRVAIEERAVDSQELARARTCSDEGDGNYGLDDDETISDFVSRRKAPSTTDTAAPQRYICGRPIPLWCTTVPKAIGIASCVVKYAPCFWCSRESLSLTTTNQAILLRLSTLSVVFAWAQIGSAVFLTVILFSNVLVDRNARFVDRGGRSDLVNTPNLWSVNANILGAGVVAVCTLVAMHFSRSHLRDVDLPGNLRFMWFMLWVIPIQVYLAVSMFDYHNVTDVYVIHWWNAKALAWFRYKTCVAGTYNTLCVVPIDGLPLFQSEDDWCEFYYNSTLCTPIRNEAQSETLRFSYFYYTLNGVLGVVVFCLLILMVKVLESVITKPILAKSRERNIPLWLTLPIVGCIATGVVLLFSPSSILRLNTVSTKAWPGVLYIVAGLLYFIAACLGYCMSRFAILNARDKHTKSFMVVLFLVVMVLTLMSVATLFVGCVLLSTSYVDTTMNYELRGTLACSIAGGSCSYCGNDKGLPECPEWSEEDVSKVIKTQLKASATLAALFMFYSLGAVRFGMTLRRHVLRYQIDYV